MYGTLIQCDQRLTASKVSTPLGYAAYIVPCASDQRLTASKVSTPSSLGRGFINFLLVINALRHQRLVHFLSVFNPQVIDG